LVNNSTAINELLNGVALVPQAAAGPSINLQPTGTSATSGTNATFSAFATGVPAPTIQWMVNQNDGSGYQQISGANAPTLTVPSVTASQNGYTYEAVFTNASGSKTSNPATLTVTTAPELFFDASTYTVNEGANNTATETITVDRLGSTATANSVTITTHNGSAVAGTNYTTAITGTNYSAGVLTFQPGDASETFTVPILSPHPQGGNVSFTITLGSPTGGAALGAVTTTTVTITDNLETFTLAGASYNVDEPSAADVSASDTNAQLAVVRSGLLDAATISYNTVAGTAADGTNYTGTGGAFSGSVTFAAGQQVANISVPILSVASQGGNKTFTVNLSVTGSTTSLGTDFGQLGAVTSATETIIDTSALSNSLAGPAAATFNAEPSGNTPFNANFTLIVGDISTTNPTTTELSFYEYSLFEFTPQGSVGLYPATGFQVTSLSNLSLSMFTPNDGAYHPLHSGGFNVYYLSPADINNAANTIVVNPPSPTFNNALSDGVDATQFQDTPQLLGTFGFEGGLSTGTFVTYTPASLSPTVTNAVLADLNGGLNFGLIVSPQTQGIGSIATRVEGVFTTGGVNQSPAISISGNVVQTAQPETLALSSSNYSISETAGTESITLTRTGDTSDTASVNYSLTDGNAFEGTNYGTAGTSAPPISGTATFSPNSPTTSFNVPIINAPNMQGDKALAITISNPTSNSSAHPTLAVLGLSTAILTIQDSNDTNPSVTLETLGPASTSTAPNSNDPPVFAARTADVEEATTGVFSTSFRVAGSAASFPSYAAADFNDATALNLDGNPDAYSPSATVTALNSITLTVFNSGGGASGLIDIYLVPSTALSIAVGQSPPDFDPTNLPEGLDSSGANSFGTPMLLGQINWNSTTAADTYVTLPLINYTPSTAAALMADLNNKTVFRIVATPEVSTVLANWGNVALFQGNPEEPVLTVGVQEGVVSSLPAWLASGSNATWTLATNSLVVHGAADIIADPGSAEPIITTDGGAASVLKVDVASGGTLQTIHIGGITLTGGASMIVDSVGSGRTATNHDELLIASGGAFSIDSSSKLDLVDNDADFVGGNLSTITNSLESGFNASGSWWTGSGIISSKAAASPASKTLGVKMTSGGDVLVKYTYVGDADLSGTLTAADYVAIDNGFNMSFSGYANGDFNYDGKINGDDYALIDNSYNTQATISGASPLAVVAGSSEQIASAKPVPTSVFATGVPISVSAAFPVLTGTAPAGTDSLFADDNKRTLAEDVLG
jgi:Immunoglobulin domain/Calx-beta domain